MLDVAGGSATLVAVDRCVVAADDPLPIGAVLDTIAIPEVADTESSDDSDPSASVEPDSSDSVEPDTSDDVESSASDADSPVEEFAGAWAQVAAPALSFDGSTVVWSTGREIRRYERAGSADPFVRTDTFDVSSSPMPSIVTGRSIDISADGGTVVFVAGPGTEAFAPTPGNVYAWQASVPREEPELLSTTPTGEPGAADSGSPTISNDATFVVYESSSVDLAATAGIELSAPFVVGIDRTAETAQVLVDDATAPAVSADGFHVAYRRDGSIRVLSSAEGTTDDVGDDELAAAEPVGSLAISQHGRWLVFASAVDLRTSTASATSVETPAVWAVDRASSNPAVVDTTTTTTTTTTTSSTTISTTVPPTSSTTVAPTSPGGDTTSTMPEVDTSTTVPATTLPALPVIDRFPVVPGAFPRVPTPRPFTPRPAPLQSSPTRSTIAPTLSATATPATFEPTIVNAGRRTQPVTLFNATPSSIAVGAVSVDPAGPFSIVSDGCVGPSLAPAGSCAVEVQFAPIDLGAASAVVTFRLGDGSAVTATLVGDGVPEPTLDLLPAVAGAGQTVTVFGAGFPPASTVELTQPGVAISQSVVVDPDGTFAHVVVVLPNTPTGPVLLAVAGQVDRFDDVDAELLVSSRGATSDGAALRSGVGTSSRR